MFIEGLFMASQEMAQMPFNKWMVNQAPVQPYQETLNSNKMEYL